jgi:hypothetical protein
MYEDKGYNVYSVLLAAAFSCMQYTQVWMHMPLVVQLKILMLFKYEYSFID